MKKIISSLVIISLSLVAKAQTNDTANVRIWTDNHNRNGIVYYRLNYDIIKKDTTLHWVEVIALKYPLSDALAVKMQVYLNAQKH